jgi:hypothetical protein
MTMRAKVNYRCMWLQIAISATWLLLSSALASAQSTHCTQRDAIEAETNASTVTDWRALFDAYSRYRQCDDGAISEGYSASVASLLSQWHDVSQLAKLYRAHPGFGAFLLRHINDSMSVQEAQAIYKHATTECPKNETRLCAEIAGRAMPTSHGDSP